MANDTAQPSKPTVIYSPLRLNWKNVVAGSVIGLLIVAIGVFSFSYYNPDATPVPPVVIKSGTQSAKAATKSAEKAVKKDQTAKWNSYSDSSIGISLKYPEGWGTTKFNESPIFAPQNFIDELKGIQEASKKQIVSVTSSTIETKYQNDEFGTVVKSSTKIASKSATRYVVTYKVSPCCNISPGDIYTYVVVENNGKFIRITLSDQTYSDTFETVLSTIKFLN